MAKVSTTIRTDQDAKKQVQQIFSNLGMDISTAVNIFFHQVIRNNGLPFDVVMDIPNAETITAMQEVDDMIKNGTGKIFNSVEELFEELNA